MTRPLFFLLVAVTASAADYVVTLRETAGVARVGEPVVLDAAALVAAWGRDVPSARLHLATAAGEPVTVQVDERDGGSAFVAAPNGVLEAGDEIVWQADVPAGGAREYRFSLGDPRPAAWTSLRVEPNPEPNRTSATIVVANDMVEIGVRGWPADPKRWSGAGTGQITSLRLAGAEQVFQGEGHNFVWNCQNLLDPRLDTLEVIARGPVRAVVQMTGPPFTGRDAQVWGAFRLHAENLRAVRTYALYDGIPWLVCTEAVVADRIYPNFISGSRFLWRPGGPAFHPDTMLWLGRDGDEPRGYRADAETYGDREPADWVGALRPDGVLVPVLFFDPRSAWRTQGYAYEPWMAKYFADENNLPRRKCFAQVSNYDPDSMANGRATWTWTLWATDAATPAPIAQRNRAWLRHPLGRPASARRRVDVPGSLAAQQTALRKQHRGTYAVFTTDNLHKVFRTLAVPGDRNGQVRLTAGRREAESVQLAVVPLAGDLADVRVTPGVLEGGRGAAIPVAAWTVHCVGDIGAPAGLNAARGLPDDAAWPDPLLPYAPFACPAAEARAVLLTVTVPADARAGRYRGAITVQPAGQPATEIDVRLEVLDFTLPVRRTMVWDSWYHLDAIARFAGTPCNRSLEQYQADVAMLARYRAVPGLQGWITLAQYVDIWREADGNFTVDFSRLDPWIAASRPYGNFWNPNFCCNSGWLAILDRSGSLHGIVRDRATGKKLTAKDLPERSPVNPKFSLLYEQFMKAYVAHLQEQGWLADAWLEQWDEPVRDRVEPCKEHHAFLHEIVPDLKLMAWGLRPRTDAWAAGYTDAWAPNLHAWHEEQPELDQRRAAGTPVFFYTCGADHNVPDFRRMQPDIAIWDPNVQRRVYAWLDWKLRPDATLIFMMTGFSADNRGRDPDDWQADNTNTFWLIYPTPDLAMLPSLRLDALRDGFEDYEYLAAARAWLADHDDAELRRLLDVSDLVPARDEYALDKTAYDDRRTAIARRLAKLRR